MITLNEYLGGKINKRINKRKKLIPQDKEELKYIIKQRLKESPDLDLNDIDVSEVEDVKKLFMRLDVRSVDISSWNIGVVDDYMFYNCKNLKSVILPDSVRSIGDGAFFECDSLTDINIPDSIESIGDGVFSSCNKLTDITIPDSVKSIENGAFYEVPHITYHGHATWKKGNEYWGAKSMN